MKNIALGILMVILLSVLVEPMVEIANVTREKIILGAALSNASRAAKDRSLKFESQRVLDAEIDEDRFVEYFSEAFENAMNLSRTSRNGNTLSFRSDDGKYNDFTVTVDIREDTDPMTEQVVTEVAVKAVADYKFRTKYLKLAANAGEDVGYKLTGQRNLVLSVKN